MTLTTYVKVIEIDEVVSVIQLYSFIKSTTYLKRKNLTSNNKYIEKSYFLITFDEYLLVFMRKQSF